MSKRVTLARIKFFCLIIFFIILLIISLFIKDEAHKLEKIKEISNSDFGGLIFIGVFTLLAFLPVPVAPTFFLGALVYTIGNAFIYTLAGLVVSSTLMFYLARWLGREFIEGTLEKRKKIKELEKALEKKPFFSIFLMRFFYIIPAEFVSIAAGFSRIKFKHYFWATFLANIPLIFFSCALIRSQIKHNVFGFWMAVIGLIVILLIPILVLGIRKIRKLK